MREQVKGSSRDPAAGLGSKFCSICTVIPVSTWGKEPGSAPETRGGLGEALCHAHMCVGREVTTEGLVQGGGGGGDSGGGGSVSGGRSGSHHPGGAGGVSPRCPEEQESKSPANADKLWLSSGSSGRPSGPKRLRWKSVELHRCHPLPKPGTNPGSRHPAPAEHHVQAPQQPHHRLGDDSSAVPCLCGTWWHPHPQSCEG